MRTITDEELIERAGQGWNRMRVRLAVEQQIARRILSPWLARAWVPNHRAKRMGDDPEPEEQPDGCEDGVVEFR